MLSDNRRRMLSDNRGRGSLAQPQSRKWNFFRPRREVRDGNAVQRHHLARMNNPRSGDLVVVNCRPRRVGLVRRLRISLAGQIIRKPVALICTAESYPQALRVFRQQGPGALTSRQ